MSIFNAILFGIIQGFSEFFPVSSSAHLSILGNLFGMNSSDANYMMFCVFLHLGSILAVVIYYLQDIWDMIYQLRALGNANKKAYPAARLFLMICISSAPLLALIPLSSAIDTLFYSSVFIGIMLIISGTLLFVSDHFINLNKDEKTITLSDALIVGLCQLAAAIPGLSRVAVVVSAGMAVGGKREFSVKYAFLLSVPALFGVNILHFVDATRYGFSWAYLPAFLVGMAVSFGISLLAIKIMDAMSKKLSFNGFAYYCWVAGVLFIVLTMIF